MAVPNLQEATWERMIRAVETVRERCHRAAKALEAAGVPYAVVGGHAVANWIASIDEGSVRNTRDVDVLIRRADFAAAKAAMEAAGFVFGSAYGVDFFLDGPDAKPSEGVHLLYAGEKVKDADPVPAPEITEAEQGAAFRVLSLEPLVRMKLVAFRRKDQVHLQDMVRLGLIDATWPDRFPQELAARLREIIADPDG
ncbi:MAG: nucleotidyltransferase family protein [Gemmataceae bacterium]|nr:nucleotidyltransferase family protein [Gemmataceae bacterium]